MINVIFWSQTGNTEAMAEAIGKGITDAGKQAVVKNVGNTKPDELKEAKAFALGCPAMGDEVLEEDEMEPFVEEVCKFADGKTVLLFGSYGWGDGQWMRDWEERMTKAGATVFDGKGLMANDAPAPDILEECQDLGKALADL